ncbi:PIN domain-containing protein [Mesorhizobium sp. CN2-181]|uniref:PIN domain-containing protein n=1 Tax=Mesorhizobium yinganensis TaxID=3157707 RepID=UPI0032B7482E
MPGVKVFVDTNVLLYSHDKRDPKKLETAREWLRQLTIGQAAAVNLQVLNELTDVLLRKKWLADPETVFSMIGQLSKLGDSPLTQREVAAARALHIAHRYSWWDCLLLASALELGCTHFLSEDLQDGQTIRGLTIVDPFAHSPDQILISR